MKKNWRSIGLGILIVVLTVAAYLPATRCGYIWDDNVYVTGNVLLTEPDGLRRIWFSFDSPSQYFPLTYTALRVEHALWGLNAAGYHWINILLHAANALILWRLLVRLSIPGAWLGAMLWALHPVQVESVVWITEQKNVLMGFFFLLALRSWVEFVEADEKKRWHCYAASLAFYALALFAKTIACTLPAALFLILWLKRKPVSRARWLQIGPFVLFGLGMGFVTVWWERYRQGTQGQIFSIGLVERILIAARAVWFYGFKLLWPAKLTFSYPHWDISAADPGCYAWLLALAAVAAAIFWMRKYAGRGLEVALVFFVATLSPVAGFIMLYTFKYSFVADHYQYVASIGPISLVAAGLSRFRKPMQMVLVALLLLFGGLTWRQTKIYRDLETLWRDTLAKNPASWMAHNNLGVVLKNQGKLEEAIQHYEQSLQLKPDNAVVYNNLGLVLEEQGKLEEAIANYVRALQLKPDFAEAHNDLGNALAIQGKWEEAMAHYARALQFKPDFAEAHNNLGKALATQGKWEEAMAHYARALQLKPDSAVFECNWGDALAKQGKLEEAVQHYEQSLQLKPDFALAHDHLGNTLATQGKLEAAMAHYARALQLKPDSAVVQCNLGGALAKQGKLEEAIRHFQQALDLATAQNNTTLAETIRTRLKFYQSASPQPQTP